MSFAIGRLTPTTPHQPNVIEITADNRNLFRATQSNRANGWSSGNHSLRIIQIAMYRQKKEKKQMLKIQRIALAAAMLLGVTGLGGRIAFAADGPTDPQIVGIVLAADQIDIDYGKIALSKSKNKQVREFANRMVTDHSAVQENVIALADKLGVKAEDSPTSSSLKSGAADITQKLKELRGKEFDKFYIDNEVTYHKNVTDAVDAVLIPSAQNGELKAALQGAQPLFLKHLEHARSVQSGTGESMSH